MSESITAEQPCKRLIARRRHHNLSSHEMKNNKQLLTIESVYPLGMWLPFNKSLCPNSREPLLRHLHPTVRTSISSTYNLWRKRVPLQGVAHNIWLNKRSNWTRTFSRPLRGQCLNCKRNKHRWLCVPEKSVRAYLSPCPQKVVITLL